MRARTRDTGALLAALGSILCFGSTPVFLRAFIHDLDSWTVNGLRYTVGALFWLPFVVVFLRDAQSHSRVRPRHGVWKSALVPALVNTLGQIAWAAAPYYLEANTIGFVYKMNFFFTILFGVLFIREERPVVKDPWFLAGTAVCIAGVVAMFVQNLHAGGARSAVGMAILLASTVLSGAYAVCVRQFMAGYPARLSFGVISLYTAGSLLVLMFAVGDYGAVRSFPVSLWPVLVLSAITGIAFAHVLFYRAIQGLGAIVSTGLQMSTPFVTLLGATVFLSERLTFLQSVGGVLVVAGGFMLVLAQSHLRPQGRLLR
ncbi:MAG: DMT family transporter [Candidatus Hydrogenedentes bacterium]|nr:DMT family transporter [Candidatus Hydrogenedentota bacterium]